MWNLFPVQFHRLLFVLGTVGIAVSASRVANNPEEYGSWCLTLAAVVILVMSDVGREIELVAQSLAASSGFEVGRARRDVANARAPRWFPVCTALAVTLILASIAFFVASSAKSWVEERREAPADAPAATD